MRQPVRLLSAPARTACRVIKHNSSIVQLIPNFIDKVVVIDQPLLYYDEHVNRGFTSREPMESNETLEEYRLRIDLAVLDYLEAGTRLRIINVRTHYNLWSGTHHYLVIRVESGPSIGREYEISSYYLLDHRLDDKWRLKFGVKIVGPAFPTEPPGA